MKFFFLGHLLSDGWFVLEDLCVAHVLRVSSNISLKKTGDNFIC